MSKELLKKIVTGMGIASAGGAITLGAGTMNLTDVDFMTTVMTVVFSALFNLFYEWAKRQLE